MLFTFFIIMTICFVLVKLLPLTPATQFGKDAELILARRKALGYDKPIIIQYFIFLNRSLIHGDWGISEKLYFGQDVWDIFVSTPRYNHGQYLFLDFQYSPRIDFGNLCGSEKK